MPEQDTPKAAAKQVPYYVFEARGGVEAMELSLVTTASACTEKDARWAAVDADPDLKARATPQDGKAAEGVNLVAIAARYVGEPVLTREELDVRTVRR